MHHIMADGTSDTGSTKARNTRSRAFVFTWNNYPEDFAETLKKITTDSVEFYYQPEVGTNGTPHIQGCIRWANPRYFSAVKELLPQAHWESCKNWKASVNYCQKSETRAGPCVSRKSDSRNVQDPLEGKTLYDWQQNLLDIISGVPDDRTIHWVVDYSGGRGKTSFCKSICLRYPSQALYLAGKASDMMYGVTSFLDNSDNDLKICLLDFTRTVENFVSYQGLESIKNGIFYNTKYESKMVMFNSPHLICFSNFMPDRGALSSDRWHIIELCAPNEPAL